MEQKKKDETKGEEGTAAKRCDEKARKREEALSFIKRKIGSCLSECNISTDSFGGNISSSGKNSIKSRR